jgi:putative membrane protein
LFFAIAGASGAALAANAGDAPPPAVFVAKAAQDGMTEVELGKVALDKSKDAKVREFAQRMVTDHSKANRELAANRETERHRSAEALDAEHQDMVKKLESQSGEAFDVEYSRHMNMDHSKAIELFEATSQSSDADLANFAKKTLPTLKEHKQMASKLPGQ